MKMPKITEGGMMEVTLSKDSIDMLAAAIAEKMAEPQREKEVGVQELSELIEESTSNIYKWCTQVFPPVPHRKRGKQLRFLVSEVRAWKSKR